MSGPDYSGMRSFPERRLSIRDLLQAIEVALMDAGYDHFVLATEYGSFQWQTVERARVESGELPGDRLEH